MSISIKPCLGLFGRAVDCNNYGFRSWRLALLGYAAEWNKGICLWKVSGGATLRDRIRHHSEIGCMALAVFIMARQVNYLPGLKLEFVDILRINENYTAATFDTAVSVIKIVNCRVELIVRANGR